MMRALLLCAAFASQSASAVTVEHIQWRVTSAPGGTPAETAYTTSSIGPGGMNSAFPMKLLPGCVFFLSTMHLATKEPSHSRRSYLVLGGVTSVTGSAPVTFDPPFAVPFPLGAIVLINNYSSPQYMIGIITGYRICEIPPGEDLQGWILATQEGLIR